MNLSFFVAKRLVAPGKEDTESTTYHRLAFRIGLASIAVSATVVLLAFAIMHGFHGEIENKVAGFTGHIQLTNYVSQNPRQVVPLVRDHNLIFLLRKNKDILSVSCFINQIGLLQKEENTEGVLVKGVDPDYDWAFLKRKIISGSVPCYENDSSEAQLLVSKDISVRLNVKAGDILRLIAVDETAKIRKLKVSGIYKTRMQHFDGMMCFSDIRFIHKLKNWEQDKIEGYEIRLRDVRNLESVQSDLSSVLPEDVKSESIRELFPEIFDWLNLLHANVYLIMILMIMVSCINMISVQFIVVIEKAKFIGMLKAIGMAAGSIRRIFFWKSVYLTAGGLAAGNILNFVLGGLQQAFHPLHLDPESYFIDHVPVEWNVTDLLLINGISLVVILISVFAPLYYINFIKPMKAIKTEM